MLVVLVFALATIITGITATSIQYFIAKEEAVKVGVQEANDAARDIDQRIISIDRRANNVIQILANNARLEFKDRESTILDHLFSSILANNPDFYSISIANSAGDLYEFVNLKAANSIRKAHSASHRDFFLRNIITGKEGQRIRNASFLDKALKTRYQFNENTNFNASGRAWFDSAKAGVVTRTKTYVFQFLQRPGVTYSGKNQEQQFVIAVDIALDVVSNFLNDAMTTGTKKNGEAYIVRGTGEVVSSSLDYVSNELISVDRLPLSRSQQKLVRSLGTISASSELDWPPMDFANGGVPSGYLIDKLRIASKKLGLPITFTNGWNWPELKQLYREDKIDVLSSIYKTKENNQLGYYSKPIYDLPIAVATKSNVPDITNFAQLYDKKVGIPIGWSVIPPLKKAYPKLDIVEVESLHAGLNKLQSGELDAVLDTELTLKYNASIFHMLDFRYHFGLSLDERDYDSQIYVMAKDAEIIKLLNYAFENFTAREKSYLQRRWLQQDQLMDSKLLQVIKYPEVIEYLDRPELLKQSQLLPLGGEEHLVYISNDSTKGFGDTFVLIAFDKDFVFSDGLKKVTNITLLTAIIMASLVPISWLCATPIVRPIRNLVLQNEYIQKFEFDKLDIKSSHIVEIDDLSNSLKEMAFSIQTHERQQDELLDSFVKLIASAIDDKSPYTAGHCNRVPELGIALAEIASESELPYFKDFTLSTKEEKREFHIAAWLHDCGKIITPEHIVDKGTKLECIYNRIHEVRMRFEVLLRDARITYLTALKKEPSNKASLDSDYAIQTAKIIDDFEFVALCNQGGEFMSDEAKARLGEIAKLTWLQYFDSRLGLSPIEQLKLGKSIESEFKPLMQHLLIDSPLHITKREKDTEFAPELGINIDIPKNVSNLGELYNLCINRGTLTEEDRYIINGHIIGTIKMLNSLPFPDELKNVPRYASTHHETLDGRGYPRKLVAADLSIPERILVLADIFEALTAADRPYKSAKPLSVSLKILHSMCLDNHIDAEVFKLFLRSGIYMDYAKKYLNPSQIDAVDIDQYLAWHYEQTN